MKDKKHWWLRDKPFSRVRYSTLMRLGLLFIAEVVAGKEVNSVGDFLLWLEDYMEENE